MAQSGKRPPPPSANETGPRHLRPLPPPQCNGEWSTRSARGPPLSPPSAGILRASLPRRFRRRWTRPTGEQRPGLRPTFCGAFPFPTNKTTAPPSGLARIFCQGAGCEPKTFPLTYRFIPRCSTPPSTNPQIRHHRLTAWGAALVPFLCLAAQLQLCHRRTSNQNPILFSQNAVDPASSRPGPDLSLHSVRQHASPLTESSNTPPSPPARCGGPSGRVAGSTGSWFGAAPVSPPPAWPGRRAARPGAGG